MSKVFLFFGLAVLLGGCKTYTMDPQDLKDQLLSPRMVSHSPTLGEYHKLKYDVTGYNYLYLPSVVASHKGTVVFLNNFGSLETRLTMKNGKKYHFYFDTLILKGDTLVGGRSRFISLDRTLSFDSIAKVEVQDGHKGDNCFLCLPKHQSSESPK